MNYVCTINEANMGLQIAAISARYMAQAKAAAQHTSSGTDKAGQNVEGAVQVGLNMQGMLERMKKQAGENMAVFETPQPQVFVSGRTPEGDMLVMRAHQAARAAIKSVKSELKVGLTLSLHDIQATDRGAELASKEWEEEFIHYIPYIKDDDFFGLQNYTRSVYGPEGILPVEPGVATSDDARRIEFIERATNGVANCIADGIDVKGYMYWSLMDNFEWQKGFSMTFGLIAVDRTTQKRTAKPSLEFLGHIAD